MTAPPQPPYSSARHRRTVRIVKKRKVPQAAYVSLAAAAAAAALLFALWRALKTEEPPTALLRAIEDVEIEWRCVDGHVFTARGEATPRSCIRCGKDAYPTASFRCPMHGNFDVAFQFESGPDGRIVPTQMRASTGDWEPFASTPHCPRCSRPMTREISDPLDTRQKAPAPRRDGR
jgi:hypothetical protein